MKTGFNRRNAGRLVLVGWAAALAWLAQRQFGKNEATTMAEATVRLAPESHFYAVLAQGRQIGIASVSVDTIATGVRLTEVVGLDLPEGASTRRMTRTTSIELTRSLRLRRLVTTLAGGGLFEELEGSPDGDSVLIFHQRSGRTEPTREYRLAIQGEVIPAQVVPYRLAFSQRLTVGRAVSVSVLDPLSGEVRPVAVTASAESTFVVADSAIENRATGRWEPVTWDTVRAWRVENEANGTPVVTWVDARGGLVSAEALFGMRIERGAFEVVTQNYKTDLLAKRAGPTADMPGMQGLLASGKTPSGEATQEFALASHPIEQFLLPHLRWLDDGRQSVVDGRLVVRPKAPDTSPARRREFLAPAPVFGHPMQTVRTQANLIVGDATADAEKIARLNHWVATHIGRDAATDARTDPDVVLLTRTAGADGHVRLFTEMARASGITARAVAGVAVLADGVYNHAWAEVVSSDGTWTAVDPTFDQIPAATTLVRLSIGRRARAMDLIPLVGSAVFQRVSPAGAP
ncbi:MAG: transglutaminase-like domain-containing protein [Gemmatimonadota bacterium]